jgi:hypothetical protein
LYDYVAQNEGELSFKKGDEITVLSDAKEGWYNAIHYGTHGFVPSNYVQVKAGGEEDDRSSQRKEKREKMMAERRELRAQLEAKTAHRKLIEEEVMELKRNNDTKRQILDKFEQLSWEDSFLSRDALSLWVQLRQLGKFQKEYQNVSSSMLLDLTSFQGNLNKDIKAGNPLEEPKVKIDEKIEEAKRVFQSNSEKLGSAIKSRDELIPLINLLFEATRSL